MGEQQFKCICKERQPGQMHSTICLRTRAGLKPLTNLEALQVICDYPGNEPCLQRGADGRQAIESAIVEIEYYRHLLGVAL